MAATAAMVVIELVQDMRRMRMIFREDADSDKDEQGKCCAENNDVVYSMLAKGTSEPPRGGSREVIDSLGHVVAIG